MKATERQESGEVDEAARKKWIADWNSTSTELVTIHAPLGRSGRIEKALIIARATAIGAWFAVGLLMIRAFDRAIKAAKKRSRSKQIDVQIETGMKANLEAGIDPVEEARRVAIAIKNSTNRVLVIPKRDERS